MTVFSPGWTPSPVAVWRTGAALLWAGLGGMVLLLLGMLWLTPSLLPLVPVLLVGGACVVFLLRRPFLHLCVVLLSSALILKHEPGVQVSEVLYGLYVLFFLATWTFDAVVLKGIPVFASRESRTVLLFLLWIVALVPVSFFFGASTHTIVREVTSLSMLGFFFPVREACRRYPNGARILIGITLALMVFVIVRNVILYQAALGNAKRLADMVAGRVVANEHMLSAGALSGMVFFLYADTPRKAVFSALVFVATFGALLLSMSRGFWLAFAWGVCFLLWMVDRRRQVRLVVVGGLAAVPVVAVAFIFFGNFAQLFLEGLVERIGSVRDSTTSDISMLGRIYESRAALSHIASNPVIGHGAGVPFTFTTILTRTELTTTFIHNGYLYMWYAFGIPGALLILSLWWRAIGVGVGVFRRRDVSRFVRLIGLSVAAALFCYTLSAMTSNPFWHKDYLLGFGFLTGLVYGIRARAEERSPTAPL